MRFWTFRCGRNTKRSSAYAISSLPTAREFAAKPCAWSFLPASSLGLTPRKNPKTGILLRLSCTCSAQRSTFSKMFRMKSLRPTFAAARIEARPFMDLFPRASRNTFLNRAYIGETRILATGCPPRRGGRQRKKSRRDYRTRLERRFRLHGILRHLHRLQHAAGAGHLHGSRGATLQESRPLARTPRGPALCRMGLARLRRLRGPRFWRAGPPLL